MIAEFKELLNISCPMYDGRDGVNLLCAVNSVGLQLPDMKIKDEALNFLSTLGKTERFFLGVGFHKPHVPFHIPGNYLDRHDLKNFGHWGPLNRTADLPNVAWNPWMDLKKRDDIKKLDRFTEPPHEGKCLCPTMCT